jgi:hypothetical protein
MVVSIEAVRASNDSSASDLVVSAEGFSLSIGKGGAAHRQNARFPCVFSFVRPSLLAPARHTTGGDAVTLDHQGLVEVIRGDGRRHRGVWPAPVGLRVSSLSPFSPLL